MSFIFQCLSIIADTANNKSHGSSVAVVISRVTAIADEGQISILQVSD